MMCCLGLFIFHSIFLLCKLHLFMHHHFGLIFLPLALRWILIFESGWLCFDLSFPFVCLSPWWVLLCVLTTATLPECLGPLHWYYPKDYLREKQNAGTNCEWSCYGWHLRFSWCLSTLCIVYVCYLVKAYKVGKDNGVVQYMIKYIVICHYITLYYYYLGMSCTQGYVYENSINIGYTEVPSLSSANTKLLYDFLRWLEKRRPAIGLSSWLYCCIVDRSKESLRRSAWWISYFYRPVYIIFFLCVWRIASKKCLYDNTGEDVLLGCFLVCLLV